MNVETQLGSPSCFKCHPILEFTSENQINVQIINFKCFSNKDICELFEKGKLTVQHLRAECHGNGVAYIKAPSCSKLVTHYYKSSKD